MQSPLAPMTVVGLSLALFVGACSPLNAVPLQPGKKRDGGADGALASPDAAAPDAAPVDAPPGDGAPADAASGDAPAGDAPADGPAGDAPSADAPRADGPGAEAPDSPPSPRDAASDGAAVSPLVAQLLALTRGCTRVVSLHEYALDDSVNPVMVPVCGLEGAVYWTADMDIDCDGKPTTDKCGPERGLDCCFFPDTAVHNGAGEPLTAAVTPYVVIPDDFTPPGLSRGAVVAVIYAGKVQYAIFGDTGPRELIGEASYACAEKLGIPPHALTGGVDGKVVTYIAFVGAGTVPEDLEDTAATEALGVALATKLVDDNK